MMSDEVAYFTSSVKSKISPTIVAVITTPVVDVIKLFSEDI